MGEKWDGFVQRSVQTQYAALAEYCRLHRVGGRAPDSIVSSLPILPPLSLYEASL
jgi:hypothetical protein